MSDLDNVNVARSFFDAWNAGDLSLADSVEDENVMSDSPGTAGPMNRQQTRLYNQNFLSAFPGSQFQIVLTIAQGDYVVLHWKITGTHSGPLMTPSGGSVPPTGKTATVVGSTTSLIKNGKIVHTWNFWDMSSLLIQLGLMPPM